MVNRGASERSELEAAPLSQDLITLEKSAKARRLGQHARRACYRGEGLGSSMSSGRSNTQHQNAERMGEEERLRRGAAEGAGEWWSDVRGDHHLFGWFLWLHLFAAARSDPGRRIQHPAVLDDFPDL